MSDLRIVEWPSMSDAERERFLDTEAASFDWKASPDEVLSGINSLLRPFGAEILLLEPTGDSYDVVVRPAEQGGVS